MKELHMNTSTNVDLSNLMIKLFKHSTDLIFFFDQCGDITTMNPAAEQIIDDHIISQIKSQSDHAICQVCAGYTSETEARTCSDCYLSANDTKDFSSFQVYLTIKEKGIVPYMASFQTLDEEKGTRILLLRDQSIQYLTQAKLHQNMLTKHVIEAQENERKRISRELHDSVAQEILGALVDLRVMKYMTNDQSVLDKAENTKGVLTRLLDDIRDLSVELRPLALDDFGLEAAFRSHFKRIEQRYGWKVLFQSTNENNRYEPEVETVVYRICQEAVMNSIKYSGVGEIFVSLIEEDRTLTLTVTDEGAGFHQEDQPQGTGLGLYGMKERAELVSGKCRITTEVGKGTKVYLKVPIRK